MQKKKKHFNFYIFFFSWFSFSFNKFSIFIFIIYQFETILQKFRLHWKKYFSFFWPTALIFYMKIKFNDNFNLSCLRHATDKLIHIVRISHFRFNFYAKKMKNEKGTFFLQCAKSLKEMCEKKIARDPRKNNYEILDFLFVLPLFFFQINCMFKFLMQFTKR